MYFVHPQIKKENLKEVFQSFFKRPNFHSLREKLSFYFPEKNFIFTDMGRTAFKIIVEKLNLRNSQIIMPAFVCDIFFSILKQYNIEPIFLDIDLRTFNIKIDQIKEKITQKTKAILIFHAFGLPVDIEKLYFEIRNTNSQILIIEDCAHSFGAKFRDVFVGNFGQVSFFSLYKQFPSLRGGLLVCPTDWQIDLVKTRFDLRDSLSLFNSIPLFAYFFKKFGKEIAPKMIRKEKLSKPAQINNVSLNLFSLFLKDFEKNLEKRIKLAKIFQNELKKLNFSIQEGEGNVFCYLSALMPKNLTEKRDEFVEKLRKEKIFATRIWKDPIILNKEVRKKYKINLNGFPNTIEAAKRIVNFPLQNFYEEKNIKKMISALHQTLLNVAGGR